MRLSITFLTILTTGIELVGSFRSAQFSKILQWEAQLTLFNAAKVSIVARMMNRAHIQGHAPKGLLARARLLLSCL
jgi:hypothetical protein